MIINQILDSTAAVHNTKITMGKCTLPDPGDHEAVIEALMKEAQSQEWDTNTYMMLVDADTGTAILAVGFEGPHTAEIVGTMAQMLISPSWIALYHEGFGTIEESLDVNVNKPTQGEEFRAFQFFSPDISRLYGYERSNTDENPWRLVAEGDDHLTTATATGTYAIKIRKELSW